MFGAWYKFIGRLSWNRGVFQFFTLSDFKKKNSSLNIYNFDRMSWMTTDVQNSALKYELCLQVNSDLREGVNKCTLTYFLRTCLETARPSRSRTYVWSYSASFKHQNINTYFFDPLIYGQGLTLLPFRDESVKFRRFFTPFPGPQ